jgi:hypothetical protein
MNELVFKNLEIVVTNTYIRLADDIIFKNNDYYVLFNRYAIKPGTLGSEVIRRRDEFKHVFDRTKHAMTWVILDSYGKTYEANRVKFIDSALAGIEFELLQLSKLKKNKSIEMFMIYENKIDDITDKKKRFLSEIDKYIHLARITHERGNKNEFNRTSGK